MIRSRTVYRVVFALLMAAFTLPGGVFALDAQRAVPGDRWMEFDLYWFDQGHIQASADEFWTRFAPLYAGVQGYRGVILNVGWTVQYIMDWSGDLKQRISLPNGSGQHLWVAENNPLSGDWKQQQEEWKKRLAQPVEVPQHGYGPWTYGNLKELIAALKETGAKHGVHDFKVGSLTLAWKSAYREPAPWAEHHPEAFTAGIFDPTALLHADSPRFGGMPDGIAEGTPVYKAFAAQWGSLSKAVGLDALLLRDSFGMTVAYKRLGPFGPLAPNPEIARRHNTTEAEFLRATKLANPRALLMMYSNGASAISDWRSNCIDLESVAKQGYVDIFVDQTWGSGWNDVGIRDNSFWSQPNLGRTYQLTDLLLHAAVLANTKVRHYYIVETFDAWETEDIIHTVPERLRWEIWAYSHAGVKTPTGLKFPVGSYISFGNRGDLLLSDADVHFLVTNINEAVQDAQRTTRIFGPTLVYSRETMQWQMDHATPVNDIKEWIDEQAGSVMKWPLPVLSATRIEWLPRVKSDLFVLQTPVHLTPQHTQAVLNMIKSGQPIAIFGSPVGGVDSRIERAAGLIGLHATEASDNQHTATASPEASAYAADIPSSFPTTTRLNVNQVTGQARVLYSVDGTPTLTVNTAQGQRVVLWDPPTFHSPPGLSQQPLVAIWGGSAGPYALTAGALNSLISGPAYLHAARIDLNQTMNVTAWRAADGRFHLLAVNSEEGLRDDADLSRHIRLVLPTAWGNGDLRDEWSERKFAVHDREVEINLDHTQAVLLTALP